MKKTDLLTLMESVKNTYLNNVHEANKGTILTCFEGAGIIPRMKTTPTQQNKPENLRSSRPDLMELDKNSGNGAGMYDISEKKTADIKQPTKQTKPTKKEPTDTPIEPKKPEIKEPTTPPSNSPTPEAPKSNDDNLVDTSKGYPEIKITDELKNVDVEDLDNIITTEELAQILNANDTNKMDINRNMLLIKASDVGASDKYECFTTGKGGAALTKGTVPATYIDAYYVSNGGITRPDTKEEYSVFLTKNRTSTETNQYMILKGKPSKYCVFTELNDGDIATILTKAEFDLLFHLVKND